ncbi:MAG TPA: GNAT family N-acetyltransferase [Rhodospirillales bacterium]
MAAAPTLETNRLKLVSFAEGHLTKRYIGWLNDPEVVRYSEQRHRTHTADSCRRFVATFADGPSHLWAIVAKDAGLGHIGNVNSAVDAPNRTADVAILIGEKKAWGRGFGAEAWIAVVDFLLGPGAMRKVTAGAMAENTAMLAIMKKAGMAAEGRRRDQFLLDGRPVDMVMMARFADD